MALMRAEGKTIQEIADHYSTSYENARKHTQIGGLELTLTLRAIQRAMSSAPPCIMHNENPGSTNWHLGSR